MKPEDCLNEIEMDLVSVELTRLFQFLFYLTRDPIKQVQNK